MKTNAWKYFALIVTCSLLIFTSSCGDEKGGGSVPENDIVIRSLSPDSPATLDHYEMSSNDRVKITYDYNITHVDVAQIWIQPYTDGSISPPYRYSPSTVFKGKGSRDVIVSIGDDIGKVHVDQLRIKIYNPVTKEDLRERFIDVDYTFE
jgi:hypothetical protein